MNKNWITFEINKNERIEFEIIDNVENIYPFQETIIKLKTPNGDYELNFDCFRHQIECLNSLISEAIESKATLHESIRYDIGYLWNEEMQNKPGLSYFKIDKVAHWVGLKNLVWSTSSNCNPVLSTWIYNEPNGSIILEITPSYPWHFTDPEEVDPKIYISYEEWMKTYKPFLIRTISKDIALKWLEQINQALSIINKN